MQTLYLNPSGDLEFDARNNLKMVEGPDEREQSVRLLLATNLGEWFLNTGFGLDYSALLGVKVPNDELIRAAILEAFGQEPRITEVLSLDISFDRQARKLTIDFRVRIDGEELQGVEVI